jgi:hypothetical protein
MAIHTFGDSHSLFAWRDIIDVVIHYKSIGSRLCYSFGRDKLKLLDIKKEVLPEDVVIFCFGEIDCRYHVGKHVSIEKSYQKVIDEIIEKYFIAIDLNVKQVENLKVGVYNVPPVESPKTSWVIDPHEKRKPAGSDDDRKKYASYFNEELDRKCKENGYIFINVWKKYLDSDGYLDVKYSCGRQHISNPIFLVEFLNEVGISVKQKELTN